LTLVKLFINYLIIYFCVLFQGMHKIIDLLIDRCSDPDKRTRKFACFAVRFNHHFSTFFGCVSFPSQNSWK